MVISFYLILLEIIYLDDIRTGPISTESAEFEEAEEICQNNY